MRQLAAERYGRKALLFLLSGHADELFSKEGGTEGHGKHGIYGKSKGTRREYTANHLDKADETPAFEVFVVWNAYILGNAKALLSTTLPDGMYYEITYNKSKNEIYLDAYKKFENICFAV